jgi:mRNA interferase MazF
VGTLAAGAVVLVRFPFSDLSEAKLRPELVLADCGRDDWLLCQVTSNPYSDSRAVKLTDSDFQSGSLRTVSYARPAKLFTAHQSLIAAQVGVLRDDPLQQVIEAIVRLVVR